MMMALIATTIKIDILCDESAWDGIATRLCWIQLISVGATFGYTFIKFLKLLHWL
jgi:hypothetical protein